MMGSRSISILCSCGRHLGYSARWSICKFGNNTVASSDTNLTKLALLENVYMAVSDICKEC